jgi:hypothetical protein
MGFTTSNLSLYHTFSKTPVDSNTNSAAAQLGNAINKSGHTVQSNEIWTESIPFFGLAATTTAIHTKFSATAKVNDLVKDSDGKIWQRNSTAYSTSAEFADLWSEKTKSITSFTKGTDGKYTFTEADGALVDGSYLINSEGVPTVKYYEKRTLTILTADNNANTNSDNKASRLQIDGKWIDQFIGVTDIYVNGSAAVSYAPVLRKTKDDAPMQAGPGKGYMDYCATGLILWESSAAGTEVIDCFEYVGAKLDSTVAKLSAAVFGSGSEGGEDVSLTHKVAANTAAISVLNGDTQTTGSVAKAVADAEGRVTVTTNALADRIAQLEGIQHFSVVVVPEGETLPATPVENTIYLVKEEGVAEGTYIEYIAYKSGETVVTEKIGSTAIDLSGYTTDEEYAALASTEEGKEGRVTILEGQVATLTGDAETAGSVAKALADAKDYTDTAIATELDEGGSIAQAINTAKEQAIANAKVTLTAGNGITIPNSGTQDTAFTVSVDTEVIATKQSVDDLSDVVSGVSETVASIQTELSTGSIATGISEAKAAAQAAQTTADEAKATADTAVQSVTRATDSSDLITVTDGTDVTISLSTEVATKTYVGEQASAA